MFDFPEVFMQALNLQIANNENAPELAKVQSKPYSVKKENRTSRPSFGDMIESMSRKKADPASRISEPENPEKISRTTESAESAREEKPSEVAAEKANARTEPKRQVKDQGEELAASEKSLPVEEQPVKVDFIQYEQIAQDVSAAPRIVDMQAVEDEYLLDDVQIDFLRSSAKTDSIDDLLANASEFIPFDNEDTLVASAQNLSLDDPEKFLDMVDVTDENRQASDSDISMMTAVMGGASQMQSATATAETIPSEKKDFFNIDVVDRKGDRNMTMKSFIEETFTVTDERTENSFVAELEKKGDSSMDMEKSFQENQSNSLDLAMTLTETAEKNILASDSQSAGATGSTFQQMLTQQIETSAPDFVKAGSIVLRDNNQGQINMILKPESLGNVKFNLHVSDNVITGQITVHSKEAFEAFRQNLDNLRQAFQDSGFENASLNLSLAENSSGSFQQSQQHQSSEKFLSERAYGNYVSSADSDDYASASPAAYDAGSDRQVSIVA